MSFAQPQMLTRKRPAPGSSPFARSTQGQAQAQARARAQAQTTQIAMDNHQQHLSPSMNYLAEDTYNDWATNGNNDAIAGYDSSFHDPSPSSSALYAANNNFLNNNNNNDLTSMPSAAPNQFPDSQHMAGSPGTAGSLVASSPYADQQLIRRNADQQLTPRKNRAVEADPWSGLSMPQQSSTWVSPGDEKALEQHAKAVKKAAQSKKKQIPPFVQKLSSFLDDSSKTHLIRWSDDGESFTIVDEDEFARTMIPELFKHNNYASFVRQLNMYGFHKKVGLADNSMKSSERKSKAPSEYYNAFFKRGKPDLLWLIQKPRSLPGGSQSNIRRKREDEKSRPVADSDEDDRRLSPDVQDLPTERIRAEDQQSSATPRHQPALGGQGLATLPHTELANLKGEVKKLQHQQRVILSIITQMKKQNEQIYGQAAAFQSLHDRHENSINAILTFLASFYNRSLDGHNGQNLANMFANTIPQHAQQSGNFEEVTEVQEVAKPQNVRNVRRPLALLPPPESGDAAILESLSKEASFQEIPTTAATLAAAAAAAAAAATNTPSNLTADPVTARKAAPVYQAETAAPGVEAVSSVDGQGRLPVTPPVKFESTSPTVNSGSGSFSSSQKNDDMMAAIHSANAAQNGNNNNNNNNNINNNPNTATSMNFSSTLDRLQAANGRASLMPQGQNDNQDSLGITQPPPVPDLNQLVAHRAHLDMLQKMQEEQAHKVNRLAYRLQPLSPTGSIPGLDDGLGDGSVAMAATELNEANGYFGNIRGSDAGTDSGTGAGAGFENDLGIGIGDAANARLTPANDFNLEAFIETGDYITNAAAADNNDDANDQAATVGRDPSFIDSANATDGLTGIDTDQANTFSLAEDVDVGVNEFSRLLGQTQNQQQQQQQMMALDNTTVGRVDSLSSQSQNNSQSNSPAGSGAEFDAGGGGGGVGFGRDELGIETLSAREQRPKRRRFR